MRGPGRAPRRLTPGGALRRLAQAAAGAAGAGGPPQRAPLARRPRRLGAGGAEQVLDVRRVADELRRPVAVDVARAVLDVRDPDDRPLDVRRVVSPAARAR